jgi:hypothetical protein
MVIATIDVPGNLLAPGDDMERDGDSRVTYLATHDNTKSIQILRDR